MISLKLILRYVMKWTFLILAVCLSFVLFALVIDPHGKAGQEVELVSPGMSLDHIESVLKRAPEYTCRFRGCNVVYYRSQGLGEAEYVLPAEVDSPADIPELYDSLQILVNREDTAVAIAWIGERPTIQTADGMFEGSNIGEMPEDLLDCHCE